MPQPAPDEAFREGAPFAPDLHDARHLWLKAGLLLAWVLVSFVACYFARDLQVMVAGWPLGYWIAAQGAILAFLAITVFYCVAMDRFERHDAGACAPAPSSASSGSSEHPAAAPRPPHG